MDSTVLFCLVLAAIGGFLRLITYAIGGEKIAKLISFILGILLFFSFSSLIINNEIPKFNFTYEENIDFEKFSNESIKSACEAAEDELEEILYLNIKNKFNILPELCIVKINENNFEVEKAEIYIRTGSVLVSSFEIKNFIKEKYEIEAKVVVL